MGALLLASPAEAFWELSTGPNTVAACSCHSVGMPNSQDPLVRPLCQDCHGYTSTLFPLGQYNSPDVLLGPHGNYSNTSSKCDSCHTVHDATASVLLPAPTVVGTCFSCHDGTGGFGVYGTIKARTTRDPITDTTLGSHRIALTSAIPGGDAVSGGSSTRVFEGPGGLLICTDCHSVHGTNLVTGFMGERKRTRSLELQDRPTSKLLKQRPTGATASTAEYGSDWCIGCHAGRMSGGGVVNHPVDSAAVSAVPFVYRAVENGRSIGVNGLGNRHNDDSSYDFGLGNWDFQFPYPRTVWQGTHPPICQQCHEDSRDVGDLTAAGARNVVQSVRASADGLSATDNPQFQNFPHETMNDRLILEIGDDLCLNCHPLTQLP